MNAELKKMEAMNAFAQTGKAPIQTVTNLAKLIAAQRKSALKTIHQELILVFAPI